MQQQKGAADPTSVRFFTQFADRHPRPSGSPHSSRQSHIATAQSPQRYTRAPRISSASPKNRMQTLTQTSPLSSKTPARNGGRPFSRSPRRSPGTLSPTARSLPNMNLMTPRNGSPLGRSGSPSRNFTPGRTDTDWDKMVMRMSRSPGPAYNTGTALDCTLKRAPGHQFPRDDRTKHFTHHSLSPGPKYSYATKMDSTKPSLPQYSFGRDRHRGLPLTGTRPKSGFYSSVPLDVTSPRSGRTVLGREDRRKHFIHKTLSPGPGAYQPYTDTPRGTTSRRVYGSHATPPTTFGASKRNSSMWCFMPWTTR
eukprot:gnl/Trimastix_PCT/4013.p1 GENE.gnl/Trimastix_PCT/4013~~gnl/Trimastix_PCT/4013.p1  ORF type:complete len:309 (-),score=12.90 gnl/Trimastix_PCT/4013:122-1048(-)